MNITTQTVMMMAGLAKSEVITIVTSVKEESLPPEHFEIPADYKVKMQK